MGGILGFEGGDILRQEVIEHGADSGDDGELPDILPGGRDGRAHDIGGQRELQREQDPGGEFQPDLAAAQLVGGAARIAPSTPQIA